MRTVVKSGSAPQYETRTTPGAALQRVIAGLAALGITPKRHGSQYQSVCPASGHPDRNPSFGFAQGTTSNGVVLSCQAGCDRADILEGLGMSAADMFDDEKIEISPMATPMRIGAPIRYAYTNENGELLFTKVRYNHSDGSKSFRIEGSVQRVLYNLPLLYQAEDTIWITEGEKDADRLASMGLAATTNYEGASRSGVAPKWRTEYNGAWFADMVVNIVIDNDDAGLAHGQAIVAGLTGLAKSVRVFKAAVAKDKADVSDHLDAGFTLDQLVPVIMPADQHRVSRLSLTPVSSIQMSALRWLWDFRVPLGAITLVAGMGGVGKSTAVYDVAASVTRGTLPGIYRGKPKSVVVVAAEDSWEDTIAPRLAAANADLARCYRLDVADYGSLSLPRDVDDLAEILKDADAALVILDPITSRIDGALDSHKEVDVRRALEPLKEAAELAKASIVGIIHENKRTSTGGADVANKVIGSVAWVNVPRSVLTVMKDPDDPTKRLLTVLKGNNSGGPGGVPTLAYSFEQVEVGRDPEDNAPITASHVVWMGEDSRSIYDLSDQSDDPGAVSEAAGWLVDFLEEAGGEADSMSIKKAGLIVGHSNDSLKRARTKVGVGFENYGKPRRTKWRLPNRAAPTIATTPS